MRDLARVLQSEPGGHVTTGWSLLEPSRKHPLWRLLLRVHIERPVLCSFVIRFDVTDHRNDQLRVPLPLLLAASGFALAFDGFRQSDEQVVWLPAPAVRDCVFDVLAGVSGPG